SSMSSSASAPVPRRVRSSSIKGVWFVVMVTGDLPPEGIRGRSS
uniref:Uncharacterized protein n=1 Tax=Amphimedon queenslandica TaxID=400682 RepID=A0A1X7V815_AMPQE